MKKILGTPTRRVGRVTDVDGQNGFFSYMFDDEKNNRLAQISDVGNNSRLEVGDEVLVIFIDDAPHEIKMVDSE
ncbi:hypothetical protein ACFLZK_01395 [Patescibacteria group bacterium]